MKRHVTSLFLALAAICLVALDASQAAAQGGGRGGRGGRGGFGRMMMRSTHQVQLATLPAVQEALKLSEEQKTKVADLSEQFDDERQGGGGGGRGGFSEEARAERAKLNADYAAKLDEILDETQSKRVQEIYVQANGAMVLSDEAIAALLELTDEQKQQLSDAQDDQRQSMRDAFEGYQDMTDEERTAKLEEVTKARDEALLAVLTDEQKTKFEGLKGEAVELDMSSLRGRGGRGGRGGGRRGGDDAAGAGDAGDSGAADDGA